MKVKNVVKVMNFHALVRVDRAKREAEKYFLMEQKLRFMIGAINNNMNLMLDKYIITVNKDAPELHIYVGSDMGFCGGYNFVVNEAAVTDDASEKIVIGKKIWDSVKNVVISIDKTKYMEDSSQIDDFITDAVLHGKYSGISIFYNEYINTTTIRWTSRKVFPLDITFENDEKYTKEDFVCESDINELMRKMISTYVCFLAKIIITNSFASENIMRQNSTSESLKKIDEIEENRRLKERKIINTKSFQKLIESYTRLRYNNAK